jgi:hypothetical protein
MALRLNRRRALQALMVAGLGFAPSGCGKVARVGVQAGAAALKGAKWLAPIVITVVVSEVVQAALTKDNKLVIELKLEDGSVQTVEQELTSEQVEQLKKDDGHFKIKDANGTEIEGKATFE